jgi:hypothetical protein
MHYSLWCEWISSRADHAIDKAGKSVYVPFPLTHTTHHQREEHCNKRKKQLFLEQKLFLCVSKLSMVFISLKKCYSSNVFSWRWGWIRPKRGCLSYGSILRIPQTIWVWTCPVPLYPPQIPHGLTRASAVRDRWLTTWATARPSLNVNSHVKFYCLLSVQLWSEISSITLA